MLFLLILFSLAGLLFPVDEEYFQVATKNEDLSEGINDKYQRRISSLVIFNIVVISLYPRLKHICFNLLHYVGVLLV